MSNIKSRISKKLVAYGLSAAAAISGGYLILPWEGSVKDKSGYHTVYRDAVGIPTACYGQTGKDLYGRTIQVGMRYSEDECLKMLTSSIQHFEKGVDRAVKVNYASDYQKAALVSFAYNVGLGNFQSSTLLRELNKGNHSGACDQLSRWVYAQKKKLKGLVNRRAEEREWCLGNVPYDAKTTLDMLTEVSSLTTKG